MRRDKETITPGYCLWISCPRPRALASARKGGRTRRGQSRGQLRRLTGSASARPLTCRRVRGPALALRGRTQKEERRRDVPPPLVALPGGAHAAGWWSSLVLSWVWVLRAVRSSAARTAIAAGSSTRSGSPCLSRERRASSAPALRIAARASGLSGPRGDRRTSRLLLRALTSSRADWDWLWSVRGHHLPGTTRRSDITSVPLLAIPAGAATIRTAEAGAISRCNQILTKLASLPSVTGAREWRLPSCDRL